MLDLSTEYLLAIDFLSASMWSAAEGEPRAKEEHRWRGFAGGDLDFSCKSFGREREVKHKYGVSFFIKYKYYL